MSMYELMSFRYGEKDLWKTRDEMPPPGEHLASDGITTWLMLRESPPRPIGIIPHGPRKGLPYTSEYSPGGRVKWWRRVFPFFATDAEFNAIEKLSSRFDLTPQEVMRAALRLFERRTIADAELPDFRKKSP